MSKDAVITDPQIRTELAYLIAWELKWRRTLDKDQDRDLWFAAASKINGMRALALSLSRSKHAATGTTFYQVKFFWSSQAGQPYNRFTQREFYGPKARQRAAAMFYRLKKSPTIHACYVYRCKWKNRGAMGLWEEWLNHETEAYMMANHDRGYRWDDDEWDNDEWEDDETDDAEPADPPDLGPCCACGQDGLIVRNIMCLDLRAPMPGTGWGCLVCDAPQDGAIAILCDTCLETGAEIRQVCNGRPGEGLRMERAACTEPFGHDLSKHLEEDIATLNRVP